MYCLEQCSHVSAFDTVIFAGDVPDRDDGTVAAVLPEDTIAQLFPGADVPAKPIEACLNISNAPESVGSAPNTISPGCMILIQGDNCMYKGPAREKGSFKDRKYSSRERQGSGELGLGGGVCVCVCVCAWVGVG